MVRNTFISNPESTGTYVLLSMPVDAPFWAQFFPLEPSQMQPVTVTPFDPGTSSLIVTNLPATFIVFHVMSDGSLPSVCHCVTQVAIFTAPGTFFGTNHPAPKSMPHHLGFYYSSAHLSLPISVPDGFSYCMKNHKISMTCNNIRYFFADGFCGSAGADVLQAAFLCLSGAYWAHLSPHVSGSVTIWAYSFQSR